MKTENKRRITWQRFTTWIFETYFRISIRLLQRRVTKMYMAGMKGQKNYAAFAGSGFLLPLDRYGNTIPSISDKVAQRLIEIDKAADVLISLARQHGKEDEISTVFDLHNKPNEKCYGNLT